MEDNKSMGTPFETLSDEELKSIAAGAETSTEYKYYCPKCGSGDLTPVYSSFGPGSSYHCPKCRENFQLSECKKVLITTTIDGDVHTVQGEF